MMNKENSPTEEIEYGETLFHEGNIAESKVYFLDLLGENPSNPDILNNLGAIHHTQGEINIAEEYFCRAIEIDDEHIDSRMNLINLLQNAARWKETIFHLEKVVEKGNIEPNLYNLLAMCYMEIGEAEKAGKFLAKSLELNPGQNTIKECLEMLNNSKSSYRSEQESLKEGEKLFNEGKIKEASKLFKNVYQKNPGSYDAINNLGVTSFISGDYESSIKYFQQSLNIKSDYFDSMFNLGRSFQTVQDFNAAIKWYSQALELKDDSTDLLNNLGECFIHQGDIERAKNFYISSLSKDPSQIHIDKILNSFQEHIKSILTADKSFEDISIQVVSPSDFDPEVTRRILWGDHWVKYELEHSFAQLGFKVVNKNPDVLLYLFGVPIKDLPIESYNIAWLYSHPDTVTNENLKQFDKIFCLSSSFIPKLEMMGYKNIELMIGATSQVPLVRPKKYDVVFVGNPRGTGGRKVISDIGDIPYNFKVWGNGWNKILPSKYIGGRYYDNQKLNELYASSIISINDHHPDMAREGMVAVKIFDILASGGFAISDRNKGVDEIFEDAVPQYTSKEDLRRLIRHYISNPGDRLKLMEKGRRIALSHTYLNRTLQFASGLKSNILAKRKKVSLRRDSSVSTDIPSDRPPKVLYVDTISAHHAACNVNGMLKAYRKAFNVIPFDYRGIAQEYGQEEMNRMLYERALEIKPDLIHLGKSETIIGSTIKAIKEKINTCIIHFYGDFRWDPQPWVVDIGRYADHTLFSCTDERILDKYRKAGIKNISGWWDAGSDPDIFFPRGLIKNKDVIFMGNNLNIPHDGYAKRRELIEGLLKKNVHLHVYGDNWAYLDKQGYETLHIHPFVTEEYFAEICSSAKIVLGINGVNDVKMYASWRRTVNTMACGAFHLTHYVPGMETLFENKKHLVWFNSVPEALELVDYYLSHEDERRTIGNAGRQEVLANHTWDARINVMYNMYRKTIEQRSEMRHPNIPGSPPSENISESSKEGHVSSCFREILEHTAIGEHRAAIDKIIQNFLRDSEAISILNSKGAFNTSGDILNIFAQAFYKEGNITSANSLLEVAKRYYDKSRDSLSLLECACLARTGEYNRLFKRASQISAESPIIKDVRKLLSEVAVKQHEKENFDYIKSLGQVSDYDWGKFYILGVKAIGHDAHATFLDQYGRFGTKANPS